MQSELITELHHDIDVRMNTGLCCWTRSYPYHRLQAEFDHCARINRVDIYKYNINIT